MYLNWYINLNRITWIDVVPVHITLKGAAGKKKTCKALNSNKCDEVDDYHDENGCGFVGNHDYDGRVTGEISDEAAEGCN